MNKDTEEKIQSIIFETFQDRESEWISYLQHKAEQMHLDKKSFFIEMMYPKATKNLEGNKFHIQIKSDSWADHAYEKIILQRKEYDSTEASNLET